MKLAVILLSLALIGLLVLAYPLPNERRTYLIIHAIGTPDAYGNVIMWMSVYQWNGSQYVLLQNITTSTNATQRVDDSQPINFTLRWRLNNTLASSEADAQSKTQVLMNISTIWTNQELNETSTSSDASYYYGIDRGHWNQTGKPESGVDYDVSTRYEAKY